MPRNHSAKEFYVAWPMRSGLLLEFETSAEWTLCGELFINQEYREALDCTAEDAFFKKSVRILDLGCNVGYFTLMAANWAITTGDWDSFYIEAIDANPKVTTIARERFRKQSKDYLVGNVALYTGAVGQRSGTARLQVEDFHPQTRVAAEGNVEVPYLDLDKTLEPGDIDLCKCDLEGSEQALIENYPDLFGRIGVFVCEFHKTLVDIEKCHVLLRSYGFEHYSTEREDETMSNEVWRRR